MFIDDFGRFVAKYSGLLIWPLELLGVIAIALQPDLTSHQKYVLVVAYGLPLLAVGLVCLARPHMVQQHLLEFYAKHPQFVKWRLFPSFVRSADYIFSLRVCGALALVIVMLIADAMLK